jgi:hypothetical protein
LQDVPGLYQRSVDTPAGGRIVISYIPDRQFIAIAEEVRGPGSIKIRGRNWDSEDPLEESAQLRRILRGENKNRREIKATGFRERDIRRVSRLLLRFSELEGADD